MTAREHISMATLDGMRGADRHHQRLVEDLQRDRMARGMGDGAAGDYECHPQGPRLSDRGRARSFAGGGRRCAGLPASYYQSLAEGLCKRRERLLPALRKPGSAVFVRAAPIT